MPKRRKRTAANRTVLIGVHPIIAERPKSKKGNKIIVTFKLHQMDIKILYGRLKPRWKFPNDYLLRYTMSGKTGINQPNHYFWSCDLIIKKQNNPALCDDYIDQLISFWNVSKGIESLSYKQLCDVLDAYLAPLVDSKYQPLNKFGYYEIESLSTMIVLLGVQEKTNYSLAYRFLDILTDIRASKLDIPHYVHAAGSGH